MDSRERPASAPDDDHVDDPPETTAAALAEAAEAEAVAAEAEARAAAACARAIRLRRQAMTADHSDPTGTSVDATVTSTAQRWWRRRPGRKVVAVAATIALICASFAASGYMMWQHHIASQQEQRAAEFATAARQAVMTLMSLDFNKTDEDMMRVADISTGQIKDAFPAIADEISKRLRQSKAVTKATVHDVAVESMTDDSATVLVAATTTAKQPEGAQEPAQEPESWHIALGLTRDGEQPKISSIEFVQ